MVGLPKRLGSQGRCEPAASQPASQPGTLRAELREIQRRERVSVQSRTAYINIHPYRQQLLLPTAADRQRWANLPD